MKRFVLGIIEGIVVGGIVAALVSRLFLIGAPAFAAYVGAVLTGAGTGLVAGRPIWAKEAKLEALLKALVGAFIAVIALFGVRKWFAGVDVNLGGLGSGAIGTVPAAILPVLGVLLSWVFEIDHAVGPEVSAPPENLRVSPAVEDDRAEEQREESDAIESRNHRG